MASADALALANPASTVRAVQDRAIANPIRTFEMPKEAGSLLENA